MASSTLGGAASELCIDYGLNHWTFLQALPGASPSYVNTPKSEDMTYREYLFHGNFLMVDTIAQGDCGPDTMCVHLGLQRGPQSWQNVRKLLQGYTAESAKDPDWRTAFVFSGGKKNRKKGKRRLFSKGLRSLV